MAEIVLGIGTSHSPQLQLPPDEWPNRAAADRRNQKLWYRGQPYAYPDLLEARGINFEREIGEETRRARFNTCQQAISKLADTLQRIAPDVVIITGDDEHEVFLDENLPAISVFWGGSVDDAPPEFTEADRLSGLYTTPIANAPADRVTHPTDPDLGRHLIVSMMDNGFEVSACNKLPEGSPQGTVAHPFFTVGHAFHYVYRRLMNNHAIPSVPIFVNCYFPPNQPSIKRCYEFGKALRKSVESWDSDKRVALIGSGGLSHFVIEEDLDQRILDGLRQRDEGKLTDLPNAYFNSGTSEIRNWIIMGGAMADDGLAMNLVDYVPCYRTEAGTGCAMGFATWE